MANKEDYYIERQRDWQDKSITQLSNANNFLLTTSIAFLAFCFDKKEFSKIKFCSSFHLIKWSETFYMISLLIIFLAIVSGFLVLFTRLYDIRITRHITLVRQRFCKANKKEDPENSDHILPDFEFGNPNFLKRLNCIYKLFFLEIGFITKSEAKTLKKSQSGVYSFNKLRELAFDLGATSWKLMKMQGLYFLLSIIFYFFSLVF